MSRSEIRLIPLTLVLLLGLLLIAQPCSAEFLLDTALVSYVVPEGEYVDETVSLDLEDMNDDGILDLVVSYTDSDWQGFCAVSLGLGNGTFGDPVSTSIEVGAHYRQRCHFVHLNDDAFLDAVFEGDNWEECLFSTYLGNGNGTFTLAASVPVSEFFALAPADFTGDGAVDLVLDSGEAVQLYQGQGDGTFTPGALSELGFDSGSLVAGDYDEDGDLDLAAGYYQSPFIYVAVLLNNGSGQFTVTAAPLPWPGTSLQAVSAADMNGDGHLDLLGGTHRFCRATSISFGNGDGTFGDFADIDFQPNQHFTDIGDLDGDGDLDIVANIDQNNTQLSILLNNGSGVFSAGPVYQRTGEMVRLGDMDGDGIIDAVMMADDDRKAAIVAGRGDGTLREAEMVLEEELTRMVVEDLDGDGDPDLAGCLDWGPDPNGIVVALNQGAGGFADPVVYAPDVNAENIAAGDLDGDGIADLLVTDYAEDNVVTLINNGDGTFGAPVVYSDPYTPSAAALEDLDGDGDLDAAIAHASSAQLGIRLNDGSGALGAPAHYDATRFASEILLVDIDGDGDLDAVMDHDADYDDFIYVVRNNGDGSFAPPQATGVFNARGVDACDFDGDGDLDICTAGSRSTQPSKVTVLFNNGSGGFDDRFVYEPGGYSYFRCTAGDVDLDGTPDLLICGGYEEILRVLSGNGDGTFGAATDFNANRIGTDLVLEDMDGDLDPDLVMELYGSGVQVINSNASDLTLTGLLVTGPGPGELNPTLVRVYGVSAGRGYTEWSAYGVDRWGVNVALGELDGTAGPEVLTGAGPGPIFGPHVRGFQHDGTPLPGVSYLAYGTNKWGVNVCSGDLDADGFDEIVTGAGPGAVFGPHVRGWNWDGAGTPTPIPGISYFAYGTPKWGVNVSCGDIDGDGYDEIVTGAGPGAVYGPHVRGWNCDGGGATAISAVSFLAYGTNQWGVNVSCGDIDGDGIDEMVTGPGPGVVFGPHVRAWNWDGSGTVQAIGAVSFISYDYTRWGANVGCGDLDGDGIDEIVTGPGPGETHTSRVRGWNYDGGILTALGSIDFNAYDPAVVTHGVKVGGLRY